MDNLNTDNLIQEIRSGNKEAVKSVYQAYAKDVYNFSKSITGDHDSALAATKKTFLTLFKNIQNGDEPSNIRTAALKIAYDEAYKNTAADAGVPAEEAKAPVPVEAAVPRRQPAPVIDDYDEEEEYDQGYEEEEDDFVPPARDEEEPESVYIPKGGYDTLKIDPVDVDEEQTEMRSHRRRPRPVADDFDDDYEERPRSRRRQNDYDDYDDDSADDAYYDDYDDYEEKKPRRKGLFVFCIILNVVLILILLWFLGGLLINLGVLPDIDLGYSWFNGHIYPLF